MTVENQKTMRNFFINISGAIVTALIMGFIAIPRQNEKALLSKETVDAIQSEKILATESRTLQNTQAIEKIVGRLDEIQKESVNKKDLQRVEDNIKDFIKAIYNK